jgi:hypothetical protein
LQPNFPAISVVTCRDFPALPFLASEGRDFPAVSVVSGRDFLAVAFLAWVIKKNSLGSRQIVLVSTAGFSVLNTGIFWREAKTKRLFSQCSAHTWWMASQGKEKNATNIHILMTDEILSENK